MGSFVTIIRIEGVYLATVTLASIAVFGAFSSLAQATHRLFEIADLSPVIADLVSTAARQAQIHDFIQSLPEGCERQRPVNR